MVAELQRMADAMIVAEAKVDPPGQPMPNARRFVGAEFDHQERALLVHQGGQFYAWNGTCWPPVEDPILRADLYKWFEAKWYWDTAKKEAEIKPFAPTMRKAADLLDALRAVTIIPTEIPTPSWLGAGAVPANEVIATSNGLVHWPTRKLLPHSPSYYVHHSVPFAFDPDAPRPVRWLKFLGQLWGDDAESVATLQELFGYLVSGDTNQQKMFLLVGPKRGGKGTIARVLRAMIGTHNVAGPTLASLGTGFGLQDLVAKPVAIISDARLGGKTDSSIVTERLLSISGEDTLTVDRKYRDHWTGQLPTRIVMLTNELPRFTDSSGALASRFIVFAMTNSFYGRENPTLTQELCTELPAIFNWSMDGLERLRDRGHFRQPATSSNAIQQIEDLSSPTGAFIRDCCSIGPDLSVPRADLYRRYKEWCEDRGYSKQNTATFARNVYAAYPQIKRHQPRNPDGSRADMYSGIGLGTGGTGANPLYYPQSSDRRNPECEHYNAPALVPPVPEVPEVPDFRTPESAFVEMVRKYGADHGTSLNDDQIRAELEEADRVELKTTSDADRQAWAEMLAYRLCRAGTGHAR